MRGSSDWVAKQGGLGPGLKEDRVGAETLGPREDRVGVRTLGPREDRVGTGTLGQEREARGQDPRSEGGEY